MNNEQLMANEVGKIRVRVINVKGHLHEFRYEALVFLVDHPQWHELIIGYPTLKAQGLLPEQALLNKSKRE